MYNSQYYTCEQVDQRLLQGYLDDYNSENNTSLTKSQFLSLLAAHLNNGLTTSNIVQESGNNTNKLMSQAIVTQLLSNLQSNINARDGYYQATINGGAITVNAPNYLLETGGNLRIKMPSAGTTASTLTIGNANDVQLWYNGAAVSAQNTWETDEIISVFYDGTRFMASNSQGGGGRAENIEYDNSQSGIASDNVQGALDKIGEELTELAEGQHKYIGLTASITLPSLLPAGYTILDYIANTSSSGGYIDTGIKPTDSNWKFEGAWMLTGEIQSYQPIIASYSEDAARSYRIIYNNASTTSILINAYTKASTATSSPVNGANEWNTFSIQYHTATINGTVVTLGTTSGTVITNNMCLFSNTAATKFLVGKMRRFKAWHNGTLVRDMIPCINPQGVYGMYDIVNDVFYGSSNENNFTGGN